MNEPYRRAFTAALTRDVRQVYEYDLAENDLATSMPALAELAETLHPESHDDDGHCRNRAAATLRDAIDRVGDDPVNGQSAAERREGLRELFGIGEIPGGNMTRRRDDAAKPLGFTSGSLRKGKRGETEIVTLLIGEIVDHLLVLGEERSFHYSKLRSWSQFYPDRPVYDYEKVGGELGRSGAMTRRPVFNSFINTPSYGDERLFFDGRRGDQSNFEHWDPIWDVTTCDTAILRIYIDNMAYVFRDDPYCSTANGTRVRMRLPTGTATSLRASGYIWADNADMVEDTADLIGDEPFRVVYVPGSATLTRYNIYEYGLDDSIVEDEGALIGHSVMDGVFPAGNKFEYAALVHITVRIIT